MPKPIQFEYNGSILKGEYRFNAKDLADSMETPQGCFSDVVHIPYAMPMKYTDDEGYTENRTKGR